MTVAKRMATSHLDLLQVFPALVPLHPVYVMPALVASTRRRTVSRVLSVSTNPLRETLPASPAHLASTRPPREPETLHVLTVRWDITALLRVNLVAPHAKLVSRENTPPQPPPEIPHVRFV